MQSCNASLCCASDHIRDEIRGTWKAIWILGNVARGGKDLGRRSPSAPWRAVRCQTRFAAGGSDTLAELRDPQRQPQEPYAPLPHAALQHEPDRPCPLPQQLSLTERPPGLCGRPVRCHQKAHPRFASRRRGRPFAAAWRRPRRLANAEVLPAVLAGLRVARLVALRRTNGRVRALAVGGVASRRPRARAAFRSPLCMPHQHGLSTLAGTEAVSRLLRPARRRPPGPPSSRLTLFGPFDHVSRGHLIALLSQPELQPLLPYVRQFCAAPSVYWVDDDGRAHDVSQAGEQGDSLMLAFYALAQHATLLGLQNSRLDGEAIFALIDDVYVTPWSEVYRRPVLSNRMLGHCLPRAGIQLAITISQHSRRESLADLRNGGTMT